MKPTILITAPEHYSSRLEASFKRYQDQVSVVHIPMVQSTFATNNTQMQELCTHLHGYDFVVCLSRKAIDAMHYYGHICDDLTQTQFLAIGKDNDYLQDKLGVTPPFIAEESSPLGIAQALEARGFGKGCRIAALSPAFVDLEEPQTVPVFIKRLKELNIDVQRIDAYVNMASELSERKKAYDLIIDQQISTVVFTSGSEVVAFKEGLEEVYGSDADSVLESIDVACMGPYTAAQAKLIGLKVDKIPTKFHSFDDLTAYLNASKP